MGNTRRGHYVSIANESNEWLAMTSILNTNDAEVYIQEPLVELDEIDITWDRSCTTEFESQDRERNILTQLRLEYLNT